MGVVRRHARQRRQHARGAVRHRRKPGRHQAGVREVASIGHRAGCHAVRPRQLGCAWRWGHGRHALHQRAGQPGVHATKAMERHAAGAQSARHWVEHAGVMKRVPAQVSVHSGASSTLGWWAVRVVRPADLGFSAGGAALARAAWGARWRQHWRTRGQLGNAVLNAARNSLVQAGQ